MVTHCALLQAWVNEKFSPELLYHKTEIIDCIEEQFEQAVGPILAQCIHSMPLHYRSPVLAEHLRATLCPVFTSLRCVCVTTLYPQLNFITVFRSRGSSLSCVVI